MIFLPSVEDRRRFELHSSPLPPRLIPWLIEHRRLSIWVIPDEKVKYYLHKVFRYSPGRFPHDKRVIEEVQAMYTYFDRRIVIHRSRLYAEGECPLLHELGHAVDHLYYNTSFDPWDNAPKRLISFPSVYDALRVNKPLNNYCKEKQKLLGAPIEQFAHSFAAYFCEPEVNNYNHIDQLSPAFVDFMRNYIVAPFEA
jgi:hypothetical protein